MKDATRGTSAVEEALAAHRPRRAMASPLLCVLLYLLRHLTACHAARDIITPDRPLAGNETLVSGGEGNFALGFFTPPGANSTYLGVWYNKVSLRTVVWVANREAPIAGAVGDNPGATLSVSAGGTLAIAAGNRTVVWSVEPASRLASPAAQILDNGNLVLKDGAGGVAWEGFDYPTDTLLPEMKLGIDYVKGKNRTLTSWKSPSDPSPGPVAMVMDTSGDPQVFIWNGGEKVWRSGPWDGVQFTGVPDTATYSGFTFSFVNSAREVTYSFQVHNVSIISHLGVVSTGNYGLLQRSTWVEAARAWNLYWYAPKDQCDAVSPCGPNGVCDTNNMPVCSCLRGFTPRTPAAWALRDGRDGCVRSTPLDCRNGTDGFVTVRHAKVPDTERSAVDWSLTLDQCRQACLRNCSCTAYASANVSGGAGGGRRAGAGSGCVMWTTGLTDLRVYPDFGQDLFVRLAAVDLDVEAKSREARIKIAVGASVSALALLLAVAGLLIWSWRRRLTRTDGSSKWSSSRPTGRRYEGSSHGDDLELPIFDVGTIAAATDGYSIENKLGEGGFGPVYKGKLEDGMEIAVKTLSKTSAQGLDEFKNEVLLIAKLQHRNLVRLLGCSVSGQERMLVYEYMANKSLDYFLFEKDNVVLDWQVRYRIIEGITRGLLYLHQDSRYRIIHRDLKAANVLLDKEMTPKISDFGMARIFGNEETEINTRKVVGTYGYMSPEYAMDGIFSVKSDVFSYGVLLLEIVSGRRNRGVYSYSNNQSLLGHAWSLWNEEKSIELADERMNGSFNSDEVHKCIRVGLLCVQENPDDRPLMSQVLLMLASTDATSLPTPKQPGFAARRVLMETDTSSTKPDCSIFDSATITMLEGR
ncbi:receptor-like serine/threonine-protein kinase SD1-8 precursor [Zea mays]|uniref:Receptor-like serine/threonine-protein kinase n=4 Tax=Zea mays TaxID=4577 RepID=A0A1D6GA09_MAIZE|nr:receptor-like serine/threonine-protein kinase SD1-8 precursor [Zea mays]AQK99947.1 Serine/threonine-protein kinase [Zea mays]AQK99948.1 Serine/threonine-protein kinase [Zea mays]